MNGYGRSRRVFPRPQPKKCEKRGLAHAMAANYTENLRIQRPMRKILPATELLSAPQLATLRRRSDLVGVALVAHAWLVIGASAALAVMWPNPLSLVVAIALIGGRQLGLLILMHDAAHGALCRTPRLNRLLSQLFCAWPMWADTHVYRAYHLQHHTRTQQPDDPDIILTGHYPITRASLKRKLLRDLTGRTGYAQRKAQFMQALGPREWPWSRRRAHFWRQLGPQCLVNLGLLSLALVLDHGWTYVMLWLLPLLTWQQVALRIRNIAEHACVRAADDAFGNARTTLVNLVERALFAPYWVNYHLEHHLVMWTPCYRLPRLRRYLFANGLGERIETERGYLAVLRKVTLDQADDADARKRKRASGTFARGFEAA